MTILWYNMGYENCTPDNQKVWNGRQGAVLHGLLQGAGNVYQSTRREDAGSGVRPSPRHRHGVDYHPSKSHYDFEISLYGSYVGRKTAWVIDGIDNGRPISIRQSKQSESSKQQEEQSQEK